MSQKEIAFRIEELRNSAEKLCGLHHSLYAALYCCHEEFSVNDFRGAFNAMGDITFDVFHELNDLTNSAFDNLKRQR